MIKKKKKKKKVSITFGPAFGCVKGCHSYGMTLYKWLLFANFFEETICYGSKYSMVKCLLNGTDC